MDAANRVIARHYQLDCAGKILTLDCPKVMGILNITPDSFYDGGRYLTPELALNQAMRLVAEGAAIIDVGGESSRPGSEAVSVAEEIKRVIPVIRLLAQHIQVPISIDTAKPEVMEQAIRVGASMINDINALQAEGALHVARDSGVAVCLMHKQGLPQTMQVTPHYQDVVHEVRSFLEQRVTVCLEAGLSRQQLVVDPGIGFGKHVSHNLQLIHHLNQFTRIDLPLLVGISRKSMLQTLLQRPVAERLCGSVAFATLAAWLGAHIIRAHDVAATVDAIKVAQAVRFPEQWRT